MVALLEIAGLTLVAFVSTNVDSLLVLTPLLADSRAKTARVLAGYWLALAVVLVLCWWGARMADELVPAHVIGYLGLVPVAFGCNGLLNLLRSDSMQNVAADRNVGTLSTALLILSMSGDNLGVFIALFADKPARYDFTIILTVAAAAAAWAAVARAVARVEAVRRPLERWAPRIVPLLMILVGLHILMDTATDVT